MPLSRRKEIEIRLRQKRSIVGKIASALMIPVLPYTITADCAISSGK